MGYEGIKTAIHAIKGEAVGDNLDTGVTQVTKENLADFKK
jgi:ribose transport system substrate-binding protein